VSPVSYPPTSVACVATHDLATLSGWWGGADIAERLSLGLLTLAKAGEAIAERREEKRALLRALGQAGFAVSQMEDGPLPEATAAAVHALIGGSASMFAHAQFDDLVGETIATNLPGTDRERPNWRLKVGPDLAVAFASHRTQSILAALAKGRT
jgi:4-alpha-glucanotransferase